MLTPEQIAERKNYIGASDAAAVLGISRSKTPLQVWAEKTGTLEPEDISAKISVKLGNALEATGADLFMEATGKKVHRINETLKHKKYDFIRANLDRKVEGENAVLEIKTTTVFRSKEWEGEEIPIEYICQVVHQLAVTGAERGYICVIIGNQDFIWKEIPRDEAQIKSLIAKEVQFWTKYVVPKVMPEQIKRDDTDVLQKLFPVAQAGTVIALDDEVNRIKESLESLNHDKVLIEAQIEELKNTVKAKIKENEIGETDKWRIFWKNVHRKEYTVKATDFRQLTWKSINGKEEN